MPDGAIDAPLLYPDDVRLIEAYAGLSADSFSSPSSDQEAGERLMRTGSGGCYFYRNGRCSVYQARPIDCRLFPFDIMEEEDGRLIWILYTNLCPVPFDLREFEEARKLLPELGDRVRRYARARVPGMDEQTFVILGEVEQLQPSSPVGPNGQSVDSRHDGTGQAAPGQNGVKLIL